MPNQFHPECVARPGDRSRWRWDRGLAVILLAGAILRIGLVVWFHGEPLHIVDEQHYNALAIGLVEQGRFCDGQGNLTSARPPLYPAFVALVYGVCGVENYTAVRIVQSCLALLLVVVVHAIASEMFSRRTALVAATMCCFYPSLLGFGNLLLTETLFSLLLCSACLTLQYYVRDRRIRQGILLGVLLGLAALTRSVIWPLTPFLAGFLFFATDAARWRQRIAFAAVPVAAIVVTIMPWAIRNTRVQKTFVVIDVMGGRNFMMGNYEYTPLYRAWDAINVEGDKAWHRVLAREVAGFGEMTQGQRDKAAMRRGKTYAMTHPGLTAQRCVVKFFNFWQLERCLVAGMSVGWWGGLGVPVRSVLSVVIVGCYAFAILAGVFGFVMAAPTDKRMHWFILLLIGVTCAVHTAVFGHSRYHVPLMPLIFIYSGNAVVQARSIWARRGQWSFWLAVVISSALVASWLWQAFAIDLGRISSGVFS